MSTAWKLRRNPPEPVTNSGVKVGWLESSCPCVAETDAPRTAGLRAANCGVLFLFLFFLNSAPAGWSQGVEKQPLPPTPPQRRCSKEAEEKVGGVNGRDLCMTRRHGALVYPREATNEQPNTERLSMKTRGEEREELRRRTLTQKPRRLLGLSLHAS